MSTLLDGKIFKAFAILIFVGLAAMAARSGAAALFIASAEESNSLESANRALMLASGNAEAHLLRGELLEMQSDLPRAINDYEMAVASRPADYVLWLTLARARELNGENEAAISAAKAAVTLAPFYAQPHWQLGNLLVRSGEVDEGFRELRNAAISNSNLMPSIIDLAWQSSQGDTQFVMRALQPQRPESYAALASYFRKQGQIDSTIAMFEAAGAAANEDRKAFIGELVAKKDFKDAYALWSYGRTTNTRDPNGSIVDSGFEREQQLDEPGFGWRGNNQPPSQTLALDAANPKEGHFSLRVDFNGDSQSGGSIISQLILIEPKTNYRLHFFYRTEGIVSGGAPRVSVLNAGDNDLLGQSGALTQTTAGWLDATIDFASGGSSEAVQITLQRESCRQGTCPIFGRLWLDGFSLEKR